MLSVSRKRTHTLMSTQPTAEKSATPAATSDPVTIRTSLTRSTAVTAAQSTLIATISNCQCAGETMRTTASSDGKRMIVKLACFEVAKMEKCPLLTASASDT